MRQELQRVGHLRTKLLTAAQLVGSFGYSGRTLTADSVLIPIAYYLQRRNAGVEYVTSAADASDRLQVRQWVTRSLMKRGIWGSGLDTLLLRLRDTIREHGGMRFPVAEVEQAMATVGKSLKFDETEIDELLEMGYGNLRVFPVLAMLYPGLDLTKAFHEDHIFPRSRFTRKRLLKEGVPADQIEDHLDRVRLQPSGAYAANLLGLSEQVPAKVVFLTDGPSRVARSAQ